jgi:hypothetical protein
VRSEAEQVHKIEEEEVDRKAKAEAEEINRKETVLEQEAEQRSILASEEVRGSQEIAAAPAGSDHQLQSTQEKNVHDTCCSDTPVPRKNVEAGCCIIA